MRVKQENPVGFTPECIGFRSGSRIFFSHRPGCDGKILLMGAGGREKILLRMEVPGPRFRSDHSVHPGKNVWDNFTCRMIIGSPAVPLRDARPGTKSFIIR
jgi:hypothetical protein